MSRISLKITFGDQGQIGPGKIRLLEQIDQTGSISAAARTMEMSYRRAWLLVDDVGKLLGRPVVETSAGGAKGGGARLTDLGRRLIQDYRLAEDAALTAVRQGLSWIERESAAAP